MQPGRLAGPLALLALLLEAPAPAQAPDPLAGFDAYVAQAVRDWEVPGLSVAVVRDGRTVFARGYGVRSIGQPGEVDEETLFAIGSTTKAMTAAALGVLVDEGKVRWDDPVTRHLPWFQLHDPAATREVTVRDLLTHRAGLGNADFLWYEQDATTREVVERLRHLEPAYSLRGGFVYQNIMYAAAGEVVAAASGMPWAEFVRSRLVRPNGMERTVMTLAETQGVENVAAPHDRVDGRLRVIRNASVDPVAAAGSVWSSAEDMARWLGFLLRGCETEAGERLLEPATCDELFTPQTVLPPGGMYPTSRLVKPHWSTYGLGWFQQDFEGRKVDFHTGSIDGMVAIAGLIRDEGIGVYVLANRDHAELRHALMYRVFDLFDAEAPRDWSAELKALYAGLEASADSARAAAEARRPAGTRPSLPLSRYAGTYSDPLYGTVVISESGGALEARYGRQTGRLEHWGYDTFRVRWDDAWRGAPTVQFVLDPSGAPARLEMSGATFRREPE
jgi:CubicO group peptidase (beta-lactamase class C family)